MELKVRNGSLYLPVRLYISRTLSPASVEMGGGDQGKLEVDQGGFLRNFILNCEENHNTSHGAYGDNC